MRPGSPRRLTFEGWIAGLGTAAGTRLVVGHWPRSPFGAFSDVMVEDAEGCRTLLAPNREIADFVAATYVFDRVSITPVTVAVAPAPAGTAWTVAAGAVEVTFRTGRRGPLGALLRAVPPPLAAHRRWAALLDRPAALLLPGVRTRGSAGNGRREWYGARDLHPIVAGRVRLDGVDLGPPAPVRPPVRFGFGSVPARPALVRVTTTVEIGDGPPSR